MREVLDKFETRGYDNRAKGVHLSGRRRVIATARQLADVLDEASAASDPENEYEMQQAFFRSEWKAGQ